MDGVLLDSSMRSVRAPRTSRGGGPSPMIIVQRGPASIPNGPVQHVMDSTPRSTLGSNKKKGFSSTAPRFQSQQPASSTPPSTKYDAHARLRALQNHPESTSKKGSGTFASRSKRFQKQKVVKAGEPASYNLPSAFRTSNVNGLRCSASMGRRVVPDASANEKYNSGSYRRRRGRSIGPHSYDTRPSWHASSPAASAFRSRSSRLGIPGSTSSYPGPGTYNPDPGSISSRAPHKSTVATAAAALSRHAHTSGIRSKQHHHQQPAAVGGVGTSSFRSTVKRDIGARPRSADTPGPGSYELSSSPTKTQQHEHQRPAHVLPARVAGPAVRLADTVAGRGSEALMYSQYGQLHPDASPARLAERQHSDDHHDHYDDDVYSQERSRNSMRSTGRHWTRSARRRLLSSNHPTTTPGPGAYEVALDTGGPSRAKRAPAATSVFRSSSARTELDQKLRRMEQEALPSPSNYHQPDKRLPAKFQHRRGTLKRPNLARTLQAARMAQAQAAADNARSSAGDGATSSNARTATTSAAPVAASSEAAGRAQAHNSNAVSSPCHQGGEGSANTSHLSIGTGHGSPSHSGHRQRHVYPNGQQRPRPKGSATLVLSSPPHSAAQGHHSVTRHAHGGGERRWGGGIVTGRAASAS